MEDQSEKLRALLRQRLLAEYGNKPEAAYLESQSIAFDDDKARNDIMSAELWKRYAHGRRLPGDHQQRYIETFKSAPQDFANQTKFQIADHEYIKNRDPELLIQEVAAQDSRQNFEKLMDALVRYDKIRNPLKKED